MNNHKNAEKMTEAVVSIIKAVGILLTGLVMLRETLNDQKAAELLDENFKDDESTPK